ncbi:WD40 repeat-like protein [Linnemannia elongata AG-77]|uniref:WD40 repeat-like protein n=1 Tax=Linnemannia elongata AG-77 TaxID=1314771 RepID=A0A197JDG4_9FUNG|nr:WD40 repeat-like protein [Linnemannia elongata AG-77]
MDGVRFEELPYLQEHAKVEVVAFSPNGKLFAVGLHDGSLITYDTTTWSRVRQNKEQSAVLCIAFSPNNRHLAFGSAGKTCRIWDTVSGETLLAMEGHKDWVRSVAFSPCGKEIASTSNDSTIRLWSAETGECMFVLKSHRAAVLSATYSADGRRLVSGSRDGTIRVWDPETGTPEPGWAIPRVGYSRVVLSADGRQFAVTIGQRDNAIQLVDAITGELGLILDDDAEGLTDIAFSPSDEFIVSSSWDKTVRLWDSSSGQLISRLSGHGWMINTCTFSPGGQQIASGDVDGIIRLWEVNANQSSSTTHEPPAKIRAVAYSPDGLFIISDRIDNLIQRWDICAISDRESANPYHSRAYVAFSPIGDQIAVVLPWKSASIRLLDPQATDLVQPLKELCLSDRLRSMDYSPDGQRLIVGTDTSSILLWDLKSDQPDVKLDGHTGEVTCVAYSPCGKWIISGSEDKTVRLWSGKVDCWSCVAVVDGCPKAITSTAWNPAVPMEFVTGSDDGSVRVWRISDAEAGDLSICMQWGTRIGQLSASDLTLKGAVGLCPIYRKLLVQRGAVDESLSSGEKGFSGREIEKED